MGHDSWNRGWRWPVGAALCAALAGCGAASSSNADSPAAPSGGGSGVSSSAAPAGTQAAAPAGTPSAETGHYCKYFTPAEQAAILGTAVEQATTSISTRINYSCGYKGGQLGTRKMVGALILLDCDPSYESSDWQSYQSGMPVPGDTHGVRETSKLGFNLGVKLPDGCILSATRGLSLAGGPVPGTQGPLLSAMDATAATNPHT